MAATPSMEDHGEHHGDEDAKRGVLGRNGLTRDGREWMDARRATLRTMKPTPAITRTAHTKMLTVASLVSSR